VALGARIAAVAVTVAERFSGITRPTEDERHGGDQEMARSERTLIRLAWCVWATLLALLAIGIGMLLVVRYRYPDAPVYGYWRESTIIPGVYATLGLVIATRRPRHPVGWLLMGCGLSGSLQLVTGQYAVLAGPAGLPGRLQAMLVASQFQITWVGLVLLLLLLFPTGRLPWPRWRPVAWSLVAGICLALVAQALKPRTLSDVPGDTNPFALPAFEPVLGLLEMLGGALVIVGLLGALASLVVRLRRSHGRERQQLKWFVYVALVGIVAIYLLDPLLTILTELPPGSHSSGVVALLDPWLLAPAALPITVAAAIVRHRLYDIDRVINRTLVYGLLTALLGSVYAAGVFLLGRLLDPAGGQSELAVAASTLAVAALFQPARRRVQTAVDRRFNRARYDAAMTVEAFSVRLRDEVDLNTLSAELLTIVDQTVQPTQASLWLRPMSMKLPPQAQPSNEANVA
jgi:hypothetical protein